MCGQCVSNKIVELLDGERPFWIEGKLTAKELTLSFLFPKHELHFTGWENDINSP